MRNNIVICIAGMKGTGKTDYTKEHILFSSKRSKKLIVDSMDNSVWRTLKTHAHPAYESIKVPFISLEKLSVWKSGTYRHFSSELEPVFLTISEHLYDTLIIVEDATRFLEGTVSTNIRKFLYDCKQRNNDVVFVFHSLSDIPPKIVRGSDYFVIFKTLDGKLSTSKFALPVFQEAIDAHRKNIVPDYTPIVLDFAA